MLYENYNLMAQQLSPPKTIAPIAVLAATEPRSTLSGAGADPVFHRLCVA